MVHSFILNDGRWMVWVVVFGEVCNENVVAVGLFGLFISSMVLI